MTKERVENIRKIVLPFIAEKLKEIDYEGIGEFDAKESTKDFNEILNLVEEALQQEPCEDKYIKEIDHLRKYIIKLETQIVEQEPKTGHWIIDRSVDCYLDKVRCHCSECGKRKEFPADYDHIKQELSISYKYPEVIDNFCPNCGAKMLEVKE